MNITKIVAKVFGGSVTGAMTVFEPESLAEVQQFLTDARQFIASNLDVRAVEVSTYRGEVVTTGYLYGVQSVAEVVVEEEFDHFEQQRELVLRAG